MNPVNTRLVAEIALKMKKLCVEQSISTWILTELERISKKRMKNEAKTTKPDTKWKSVEKTKSRQSPSVKKSTKVNPDTFHLNSYSYNNKNVTTINPTS
ncbi:hypothetical protein Tco_0063776 [Tanacetum coccineum]